ncbi:phospholipase [Rhodobacteraceae bacterium CH30]|nr:phospholipase [Rhodobacteraceae bacterium CH30]
MNIQPWWVLLALAGHGVAWAGDVAECRTIADDQGRLACYDRLNGVIQPAGTVVVPASTMTAQALPLAMAGYSQAQHEDSWGDAEGMGAQTLAQRWELEPQYQDGTFRIKPYQPMYILPLSWRKNTNNDPCSPNPLNCSRRGSQDYDRLETKIQLSFKTKLWQDILGSDVDLWGAYTQQSFWQSYDGRNSSPFRESDYQPELWATFPLNTGPDWLKLRMVNLGAVHQSNGETDPLSRSWNRLYASFGLSSGDLSVVVKPWWRIPESASGDNNPDISDFVGRMETVAVYPWQGNVFSLTWRNNLKFGSSTPNRSFFQFEWAFPISGNLHGYVQAFNGWGDSLQNYNFHNQGIGLGISLIEWR